MNDILNDKTIQKMAWNILKNHHDVEDAMQSACVKALTSDTVPNDKKRWIKRIVKNVAIDIKRRRKRFEEIHDIGICHESTNYDEIEILNNAWNKLSNKYKDILKLHIIEGLGHREISKLMNIKMGTSMSRTYYAIGLLKKSFN